MPFVRTALCPLAQPARAGGPASQHRRPPRPEDLAYSFTLPGEAHSAAIARSVVRRALSAHQLASYEDVAVLAATELICTAYQLTPGEDLYLSVRYRLGGLRLVLWDQHPQHRDPDAVSLCQERRLRSLWPPRRLCRCLRGRLGSGGGRTAPPGHQVLDRPA